MKRIFSFLLVFFPVLLFVQVPSGFAKEPSIYEEFDQQEELNKLEEKKNADVPLPFVSAPKNVTEQQNETLSEPQGDFFLTDEKHDRFLQENEQYALADSMLNQTWKAVTKNLHKKTYRKLWQEHKVWLDSGRNTVANSFKTQVPAIPEYHAFMLAAVAKTQELAQKVWHEPVLGRYVKDNTFVTLVKEEDKIFLQGYGNVPVLAKNNDTVKEEKAEDMAALQADNPQEKSTDDTEKAQSDAEKAAQTDAKKEDMGEKHILKEMPQLLFRAELPKEGKLWLALETVNEQKLYLLTTANSLCIVHAPHSFSFDFNGVFVKK